MLAARFIAFALLVIAVCLPVHAALSVTLPTTVNEGQTINAAVSGPGMLTILIDDVTVASGTGSISHALPTDQTSAGLRAYRFTTSDPGTQNESHTVTVSDVPFTILPEEPTQADIATSSPTFSVTATWPPELCYVLIDGDTRTLAATSPTTYAATIPVNDGVHTITYKCKLGAELPSVTRTIRIDTTPPVVTASAPTGTQTGSYATLTVDTSEIALCRYGTADASYTNLPLAMGATYATRNQITVALAQSGPQTHFVRCADVLGNAMGISHIISFSVQRPPVATVDVDGDEPLRAGSYKVTLRTDLPLAATPTLTASFPTGGGAQQIGLTGSGSSWDGYLVVPENIADASVGFTFRGVGLDGTVGTQIAEGAVARIDAFPPGPIVSLVITNSTKGIHLRWFSHEEDDDDVRYVIYRADHEGVTYTDEIARSTDASFADPAGGARYYWYRVAAVDGAGNLGPLSLEVYGSAVDSVLETSALDAVTLARVDETIISLQGMLTTANTTITALESEQNPFKSRIIANMQLLDISRETYRELDETILALVETRAQATSEAEAMTAITDARDVEARARTALIRRILPDQEVEARQVLERRDVERNLAYAIAARSASTSEDRAALLDAAERVRERSTVTLTASSFTLWDWANVGHPYTFVRKHIVIDDPVNDALLVEVIPKSVAASVDDVVFLQEPTVLERDPVVSWSFPVLQEEDITYIVNRAVSLEDVKSTQTIVYPLPVAQDVAVADDGDGITGFSILPTDLPGTDVLLLSVGAIIILALGAYYVALGTEPKPLHGLPIDRLAPVVGKHTRRLSIPAPRSAPERFSPPTAMRIIRAPSVRAPPRTTDRTTIIPTRTESPADADELLARAESAIDEKKYEVAERAYREAIDASTPQAGTAWRDREQHVHRKLMLHQRLDDAAAALERHDAAGAQQALHEVRSLALRIGDQPTTLIKEATRAYKEFMRRLNRLEIDHASRY